MTKLKIISFLIEFYKMPIPPSTSPCVNRYIHDPQNLIFIVIILFSLTFLEKFFYIKIKITN